MNILRILPALGILALTSAPLLAADQHPMGFFVTSVGMGQGADLGGLEGADAHCTKLAEAAGSTGRTWRAYLSTQVEEGRAVSARDRIGSGPLVQRQRRIDRRRPRSTSHQPEHRQTNGSG